MFSVFPFRELHSSCFLKISGKQTQEMIGVLHKYDLPCVVASVPESCLVPDVKCMNLMFVGDYLDANVSLKRISMMRSILGRPVGYSGHTIVTGKH